MREVIEGDDLEALLARADEPAIDHVAKLAMDEVDLDAPFPALPADEAATAPKVDASAEG